MRVAFIQASAVDESLALAEVAGILRQRGHRLRLFLERHEDRFGRKVEAFRPDVAVVQAAIMAEPWLRSIIGQLPAELPTLLVGTAATFDPDIVLRTEAFGAVQGELDDSLPSLLDAMEAGGDLRAIPGVVLRGDNGELHATPWGEPPDDLDGRALPDRALYFDAYPFMGRFPWKRFTTGRGCVHSCGFCYLPQLRAGYGGVKPAVRRKSVERVIEEVRAVRRRWPLRSLHFADDLFAPSRPWLEEFADRFPNEVGLPFSCNTSPETVTERNAELLARAGVRVVGIGVEVASDVQRTELLGRPTSNEAIRRAASRLKSRGVRLATFNMLANPGEVIDDALETMRFNQELGTDFPRAQLAYPTPGSHLEKLAAERGVELPSSDSFERKDVRAWCVDGEGGSFESLARLFRLAVRWRLPLSVVRPLLSMPSSSALAPLVFYDAALELGWTGVSMLDALRYARHTGPPVSRATYHESIP